MGAGGDLISSDGPGSRASRFLDAVVAFIIGIFQPVVRFLATHILPSKPRQHNSQNRDRSSGNNTTEDQHLVHQNDQHQQQKQQQQQQQPPQDGDHNGDSGSMPGQRQGQRTAITRPQHPYGPKDAGINGHSSIQIALPQSHPAPNGHAKQIAPVNGDADATPKTALGDVTNSLNHHNNLRFGTTGEDETKQNMQDDFFTLPPASQPLQEPEDPVQAAEREYHYAFMNQALDMARLALKTNETPVGCVLVQNGRVIAKGMNATNVTRNGTRHAELMALTALLSFTPNADIEKEQPKKKSKGKKKKQAVNHQDGGAPPAKNYTEQDWGDVDPTDGHIYPYGQKLHPAPVVDQSVISQCSLYVTVEPCVMCASMLRQFGIKKVFFGAVNDKFGGTGGVFCIHMNSDRVQAVSAPATPIRRPIANQLPRSSLTHTPTAQPLSSNTSQDGSSPVGEVKQVNGFVFTVPPVPVSNISKGHGGNVEVGFEAEGGWRRDEAVNLLRQFYVQENGRAPVPRKKEGRAARLAAMMESQGMSTEGTSLEGVLQQERDALEKADAEYFNGEQSNETDQDDINGQMDAFDQLSPPKAKFDREINGA